jgi:N utilization substance protein B
VEPQKRHWSRRLALQALYQWQISGHEIDELLAQYVEDANWEKTDKDYFVDLVTASINHNEDLTAVFSPYLNLASEQIDPIENSILLFATYEILHKPETPTKVILSEAINLCKKFGSIDGYKFINGVLDKVAKQRV